MNYTFDDPTAPTRHQTQHFEMLGNRAIVSGRWKAVAYRTRPPRGGPSDIRFDEDRWELYDLERDPSECRDLLGAEDVRDVDHPMARQLIQLVGLWWAEARRYALLPLDVGLVTREVGAFEDAPPLDAHVEPEPADRLDRSWAIAADVVVPLGGASGPIVAMTDEGDGWSLYLKDGAPTFCCKLAASGLTLVRSPEKLGPGPHSIRYEFEKRGTERRGTGTGRLVVDGRKVAEVPLAPSIAFDRSLDQSIEIGSDKGAPITDEYPPHASFTGKIVQVEMDLHPDFTASAGNARHARPRGAPLLQ
jgi:arylsulfatase